MSIFVAKLSKEKLSSVPSIERQFFLIMAHLVNEINEKSGAISIEDKSEKLHNGMIKQIVEKYNIEETTKRAIVITTTIVFTLTLSSLLYYL